MAPFRIRKRGAQVVAGHVEDESGAAKLVLEHLPLADVADDEPRAAALRLAQVPAIADAQVVDRYHIGAEAHELVDDVAADETSSACDDDAPAGQVH